jgi:hypothetical protein
MTINPDCTLRTRVEPRIVGGLGQEEWPGTASRSTRGSERDWLIAIGNENVLSAMAAFERADTAQVCNKTRTRCAKSGGRSTHPRQ